MMEKINVTNQLKICATCMNKSTQFVKAYVHKSLGQVSEPCALFDKHTKPIFF